jgi:hypothetical protein
MNESEPDDFKKAADQKSPGLWRDIFDMLRENKRWWLAPIIILLLLVGTVVVLVAVKAPFIYTLF